MLSRVMSDAPVFSLLLAADRASLSRGVFLLMLIILSTIAVITATVLLLQSRRRAHLRHLAQDTKRRRSEDPWKVSADRTEAPSADELYRSSGFDKDDTRIEDSPSDHDTPPGNR